MPKFESPFRPFLDGLSIVEARDLSDLLLCNYAYRKVAAQSSDRLNGREAQKALAKLLSGRDASWGLRELVLNAGRALYYTKDQPNPYYTDALVDLATRMAESVSDPKAGVQLVAAIRGYNVALEGPHDAVSAVLAGSNQLISLGTALANRALDTDIDLKRSDLNILAGIVDDRTKLRIKSLT